MSVTHERPQKLFDVEVVDGLGEQGHLLFDDVTLLLLGLGAVNRQPGFALPFLLANRLSRRPQHAALLPLAVDHAALLTMETWVLQFDLVGERFED